MSSRTVNAVAALLALAGMLGITACSVFGESTLGELVAFQTIGDVQRSGQGAELSAGQEPEDVLQGIKGSDLGALPPLADGVRRFAFVDAGCREDSAQLVIIDGRLDAQLLEDGSADDRTMCAQPVYFLSVFDVAAGDLPDQVRLS